MTYVELLRGQFNGFLREHDRAPGVTQLLAPLYYEDGDMLDLFVEQGSGPGKFRVCDHGMAVMRLSYTYSLDTPKKEEVFGRIVAESGVSEANGNLFIEADADKLYPAILQLAQAMAKVGSMKYFKKEVIASLFYEELDEFVTCELADFSPRSCYLPIPERDDLEVDYRFDAPRAPIFLFAVRDGNAARLATIASLEFLRRDLPFRGFVVHEDFEKLGRKDQTRLTSAVTKQFVSLDDFRKNGRRFLQQEIA